MQNPMASTAMREGKFTWVWVKPYLTAKELPTFFLEIGKCDKN